MKKIIYLLFLIVSTNVFAQSEIVNDDLYLKYEKEYFKYLKNMDSNELKKLDEAEGVFGRMFKESKSLTKFKKSKDQLKWLKKNLSKTNFSTLKEAQDSYSELISMKNKLKEEGELSLQLLDEVLKKYDADLVWKTLHARFKANNK